MNPAVLLALALPVLGAMPPPPGLPPTDPFGPTLAALDASRWVEAQPAAEAAWEAHRAWVDAWMQRFDDLRMETCSAVEQARADLDHARGAEAAAVRQWDRWMHALDDPKPERIGHRVAKTPKVIPGPGPECLADRRTARRRFIERRDHAAEARVMAHIEAALDGEGPIPPAACAFARQWALDTHRMYLTAISNRYNDPILEAEGRRPDAASRQAMTTYTHLLRACPAITADGELLFYFAELRYMLGDWPGAMALYARYADGWPRGPYRTEAVMGAVRTCRTAAGDRADPADADQACEQRFMKLLRDRPAAELP